VTSLGALAGPAGGLLGGLLGSLIGLQAVFLLMLPAVVVLAVGSDQPATYRNPPASVADGPGRDANSRPDYFGNSTFVKPGIGTSSGRLPQRCSSSTT
jgi:hypothetical protein